MAKSFPEGVMVSTSHSRARPLGYSASAKLMHWFVAISVITLLCVGPVMKRLVPEGPLRESLYNFHEGARRARVDRHGRAAREAPHVRRAGARFELIAVRAARVAFGAACALPPPLRRPRARLGGNQRLWRSGQRVRALHVSRDPRQGSAAVGPHLRLASRRRNSDRRNRRAPRRGRRPPWPRQARRRAEAHAAHG